MDVLPLPEPSTVQFACVVMENRKSMTDATVQRVEIDEKENSQLIRLVKSWHKSITEVMPRKIIGKLG